VTAGEARVSVIIPAYNEGKYIVPVLDRLFESVRLPCEVLVVVDDENDSTVPVVREYAQAEPRLRCLVNTYGPGPANAIRFGMEAAVAKVAVVTMADGCDDSRQIDDLARLVERGVAVAAASRYMAGGQQVGGPLVKGMLSRTAGRSLRLFARLGTRDATNSFKAYSTSFVREVGIDSRDGFEIGIELTAKAKRLRLPVAEIPTIWLDRPTGVSNFRVAEWIPKYLRWYRFAFGGRLTAEQIRARGSKKGKLWRRFWSAARPGSSAGTSSGNCSTVATRSWAWTISPSTARWPSPTTTTPATAWSRATPGTSGC
jgi:glycosyltransferase involved in cell wall biosynthesis